MVTMTQRNENYPSFKNCSPKFLPHALCLGCGGTVGRSGAAPPPFATPPLLFVLTLTIRQSSRLAPAAAAILVIRFISPRVSPKFQKLHTLRFVGKAIFCFYFFCFPFFTCSVFAMNGTELHLFWISQLAFEQFFYLLFFLQSILFIPRILLNFYSFILLLQHMEYTFIAILFSSFQRWQ